MIRSVLIYIVLFFLFSLFTYLFIDPNFLYLKFLYSGFFSANRLVTTTLYVFFISTLFYLYVIILKKSKDRGVGKMKKLIIIPLAGLLSYPAALSFDLFNYIATAKVTFHYFENPYVIMPIQFFGDPVLLFTHAANKTALYGPLWILLTSVPFYSSFNNYLISIALFKLLIAGFFFGIVWLIWKMTKSSMSVLYFAASPLVLIETFVSGHNDVVMMFFALASLYFLKEKKIYYSIILLICSILIKFATLFLLPVFIYYLYLKINKKEVDWNRMFFISFFLMSVVFFLAPIREEIYPWYAIWPMTFLSLFVTAKKTIAGIFTVFSLGLMLRYIPFMLLGTYFGPTPLIKILLTFLPPTLYFASTILMKKNKTIQ